MKKFFILGLVLILFNAGAYASCECTTDEIMKKVSSASSFDKESFVRDLFWSNSWGTSFLTRKITETKEFETAVKNYIERNCIVVNEKIQCDAKVLF